LDAPSVTAVFERPNWLQIHHVISDLDGTTGLAIMDAILAGERDPHKLAQLRHPRVRASQETIMKSLVGDYPEEHLFTLRQSLQARAIFSNIEKAQEASSVSKTTVSRPVEFRMRFPGGKNEAHYSGISWPAVISGAFTAAAPSLILLTLGTGLGFSSVSPWSNVGASASTVNLRTKWVDIHTEEVYSRDIAHGLLVGRWALC
jgi:hypothetical protein